MSWECSGERRGTCVGYLALFETSEDDVKLAMDCCISLAQDGSKGVRDIGHKREQCVMRVNNQFKPMLPRGS